MSLNDLSAQELARLDAICLDFESQLRGGAEVSIDQFVKQHGGTHHELLRQELDAIRTEIESQPAPKKVVVPFQSSPSQQASGFEMPRDSTETIAGNAGSSNEPRLPTANEKIGPYELRSKIGRGGMGVVYKAVDTRLGREVAIKFLDAGGRKRQELNDRFEREAKAVAGLSHPGIVELFDVGVANGLPFAVMEYLKGQTLTERFEEGRLRTGEVRQIGAQIADALAAAHDNSVIHRDLKPQNVMMLGASWNASERKDGDLSRFEVASQRVTRANGSEVHRVKVFDFGLSRVPQDELSGSDLQTKAGVVLGTPGYMSPEQAKGESATASADVFSLGCILYEAFYGTSAIQGDSTAERLAATLNGPPSPDPVRRRDDTQLADLIQRCLATSPTDRPTAAEIASGLRQASGESGDPVMNRVESGFSAGEFVRRSFLTAACGGALGALFGGFFQAPTDATTEIKSIAVLTFNDGVSLTAPGNEMSTGIVKPLGKRELSFPELFSSMISTELSSIKEISVVPFRSTSLGIDDRSGFSQLAEKWGVDAFVTGRVAQRKVGEVDFVEVDWQIVSASGKVVGSGKPRNRKAGQNILDLSLVARDVADVIEQSLTPTKLSATPLSPKQYMCLIDGKVRMDPDSIDGLERSIMCLEGAAGEDQSYAEPLAGIALAKMLLSARSDAKRETAEAFERAEDALRLDPKAVDARLALAMHAWQVLGDYSEAKSEFENLVLDNPNNWQAQHQYGLFLLTIGDAPAASGALRRASRLNPMSLTVKVDKARSMFFKSDVEAALRDATVLLKEYPESDLVRGLLIDLNEHQKNWDEAAALDGEFPEVADLNEESYFEARQQRLSDVPYGAFGAQLNQALLDARSGKEFDDEALATLASTPRPPMLPLLLAVHPAFATARELPYAKVEILF